MEIIQQLHFGFYEPTPRLLIVGLDPLCPEKTIVRCPVCNESRCLGNHTIYALREKGHSICQVCATRQTGRDKMIPIPESDDCIILEQIHRRHATNTMALVRCPRCGAVREQHRQGIRKYGHTFCGWCVRHMRAIVIPTTEDCIILKQFSERRESGKGLALVKCPDCGKIYQRDRGHLLNVGHTLCASCCQKGPRSPLWKGGSTSHYDAEWVQQTRWIRQRDNYTCQFPDCAASRGEDGRRLAVHHVVPYTESEDNSEHNLISLCPAHHLWADHNLHLSIPMFDNMLRLVYGPDYP